MEPVLVGVIGFAVLFGLMAVGVPVAFCMMLVGFGGLWYFVGSAGGMLKFVTVSFRQISNPDMAVLPLFLLMAQICSISGMSADLYTLAARWVGRWPGGLAMATVGACGAFAAVSSSSIATAVTIGQVAMPEMKKYGYRDELRTGCVAAGGTLGVLIPPSFILILYGIMTENSIRELFVAGVVPGILAAAFYMMAIYIWCKWKPEYGPRGPSSTFREKFSALKSCAEILVLIILVIGGLIVGWFTPSEAGGVGAFGALVVALIRRRLTWKGLVGASVELLKTTGMIFTVLIGAMMLIPFVAMTNIPTILSEFVTGLPLPPTGIIVVILALYVVLGCVMDVPAMTALTIPIFYPTIVSLGFSPIWFGVIVVRMMEIGMITPPVGVNVFVVSGMARDVPMGSVFKGIGAFLSADLVHVALLVAFPAIVTFLPDMV